METVDMRFTLIAENGDRLYPYKKSQKKTGRFGFALTKPGEQDRNGQGTYTDSIQEVIQRLVFEGWSVRAKTINKRGKQRTGTVGINKQSIIGYEVAKEFEQLIALAKQKPLSIIPNEENDDIPTEIDTSITSIEKPVDEITYKAIKSRRGQPDFRNALLVFFGGKCCISECSIKNVLEAAHIVPHSEETNYAVTNGLLLRADIHTLYDLNLIRIDGNGKIYVANEMRESEYWQYHGRLIGENISEIMSVNLNRRFLSYTSIR